MFDEHFEINKEFPTEYSDLDSLLRENAMYQSDFLLFDDPLSKKGGKLQYHSIYNSNNSRRHGYILYSAGIDGIVNYQLNNNDTVYTNEVYKVFEFYNRLSPACKSIEFDTVISFNYINYLFGTKDLLISYVICDSM